MPNEDVLSAWQNSLIKESNDGYPPKFNFRLTGDIVNGQYSAGKVYNQAFDFDNKQFILKRVGGNIVIKTEESTIDKIGKHFQVRFNLLAEQAYFIYNRETPSESRFGIKWKVEQILYIENPHLQPKEMTFTSQNYNDIVPNEVDAMNPNTKFIIEEEDEEEHLSSAVQCNAKKQKV